MHPRKESYSRIVESTAHLSAFQLGEIVDCMSADIDKYGADIDMLLWRNALMAVIKDRLDRTDQLIKEQAERGDPLAAEHMKRISGLQAKRS